MIIISDTENDDYYGRPLDEFYVRIFYYCYKFVFWQKKKKSLIK